MAEFYAVTWLWDNGFEVFVNAGATGPVDMVAINKEGEAMLIDVKSSKGYSPSGRTDWQKEHSVNYLIFNPETRGLRFVEHKDDI